MKVLITGGARSGKSRHAEQLARSLGSRRVYLATATAGDGEMEARIARHQQDRGDDWITVEEPLRVGQTLREPGGAVVLLDCLTLWLTNVFMEVGEGDVGPWIDELVQAVVEAPGPLVLVANEVGSGIVAMPTRRARQTHVVTPPSVPDMPLRRAAHRAATRRRRRSDTASLHRTGLR